MFGLCTFVAGCESQWLLRCPSPGFIDDKFIFTQMILDSFIIACSNINEFISSPHENVRFSLKPLLNRLVWEFFVHFFEW